MACDPGAGPPPLEEEPGCYQGDVVDRSVPAPILHPLETRKDASGRVTSYALTWRDRATTETCYVVVEHWFNQTTAPLGMSRVHVLPADSIEYESPADTWDGTYWVDWQVYAATGRARSKAETAVIEFGMP